MKKTNHFCLLLCACTILCSCMSLSNKALYSKDKIVSCATPEEFYNALLGAIKSTRGGARTDTVGEFYAVAKQKGYEPICLADGVVFLFDGTGRTVRSVEVRGDLNGWMGDSSYPKIPLANIEGTSFYMSEVLPLDGSSRIDYKFVVNGSDWLLDDANKNVCYGGFGPNSEFCMPLYARSEWVGKRDVAHGKVAGSEIIFSKFLNYTVQYTVYLPAGYSAEKKYPLLVTTDGQEYSDEKLGDTCNTADNLIAAGRITPIVIVFVDPRNPEKISENRRESQFCCNENYASFLATELYNVILEKYAVEKDPAKTCILGTSLGGLNSAYTVLRHADVFGLAAIQSPAIWYLGYDNNVLLSLYQNESRSAVKKIWIDAGTVYDTAVMARKFVSLLSSKGYENVSYHEFAEGHSWGSWKNRIPNILMYFFAK